MSGYFVKAVVQLVFSRPSSGEDLLLFAVGQDYKIAIYNVDPRENNKVPNFPDLAVLTYVRLVSIMSFPVLVLTVTPIAPRHSKSSPPCHPGVRANAW